MEPVGADAGSVRGVSGVGSTVHGACVGASARRVVLVCWWWCRKCGGGAESVIVVPKAELVVF